MRINDITTVVRYTSPVSRRHYTCLPPIPRTGTGDEGIHILHADATRRRGFISENLDDGLRSGGIHGLRCPCVRIARPFRSLELPTEVVPKSPDELLAIDASTPTLGRAILSTDVRGLRPQERTICFQIS